MYVKIGTYTTWWGPYQIADLLKLVGVSEDRCTRIGEYLSHTWVNTVCEKIDSLKQRKVKVRIDPEDTWDMYRTLSLIALPMLEQLKESNLGFPFVDDEDVPEELRSTAARPLSQEEIVAGRLDDNHEKRWLWVMDEMIHAHQCVVDDWENQFFGSDLGPYDLEGYNKAQARISHGFLLFGKYYRSLWD